MTFHFDLYATLSGPPPLNWTSSDLMILVEWPSPYATVGSDGQLTANVLCGVAEA